MVGSQGLQGGGGGQSLRTREGAGKGGGGPGRERPGHVITRVAFGNKRIY